MTNLSMIETMENLVEFLFTHQHLAKSQPESFTSNLLSRIDNSLLYGKDCHGNTIFHLAVMLRNHHLLKSLLEIHLDDPSEELTVTDLKKLNLDGNGNSIHTKKQDTLLYICNRPNAHGWSVLDEAIATGDPNLVFLVMRRMERDRAFGLDRDLKGLKNAFDEEIPDLYLEIQIDFKSWIPFLARLCPRDTIRIWKSGGNLRMDYNVHGYEKGSWLKSKISLITKLKQEKGDSESQSFQPTVYVLNHDTKRKQRVHPPRWIDDEQNLRDEMRMNDAKRWVEMPDTHWRCDVSRVEVTGSDLSLRKRGGVKNWILGKKSKAKNPKELLSEENHLEKESDRKLEKVGKWLGEPFAIKNLNVVSISRIDHLKGNGTAQEMVDASWLMAEDQSAEDFEGISEKEREKEVARWLESAGKNQSREDLEDTDEGFIEDDESSKSLPFDYKTYLKTGRPDGKSVKVRKLSKNWGAKIWLSENDKALSLAGKNTNSNARKSSELKSDNQSFPLTFNQLMLLLDVLDASDGNSSIDDNEGSEAAGNQQEPITPLGHVKMYLKKIKNKLTGGFPVQIEIPMWGVLTAQFLFKDCNVGQKYGSGPSDVDADVKASWFNIPESYEDGEAFEVCTQ